MRSDERSIWIGGSLIGLAIVLPVCALLFPVFGWPAASSNLLVGLLVAGIPETLCLAGVAMLGREGLYRFQGYVRKLPENETVAVSKWRYYGALIYCLLNGLSISLYAYAPQWMPGGASRYYILVFTDIGFVCSIFLLGGEFWEKFRRLFIWEGKG